MIPFITPLLNIALGIVITAAGLLLDRAAIGTLMVSLMLGPLVTIFSLMGLVYKDARYGATITGLLLILEAFTAHHMLGSPSRTFDIVAGLAVAVISLVPHPQFANNDGERPPATPGGH